MSFFDPPLSDESLLYIVHVQLLLEDFRLSDTLGKEVVTLPPLKPELLTPPGLRSTNTLVSIDDLSGESGTPPGRGRD